MLGVNTARVSFLPAILCRLRSNGHCFALPAVRAANHKVFIGMKARIRLLETSRDEADNEDRFSKERKGIVLDLRV